jgi:hypothetical protein
MGVFDDATAARIVNRSAFDEGESVDDPNACRKG